METQGSDGDAEHGRGPTQLVTVLCPHGAFYQAVPRCKGDNAVCPCRPEDEDRLGICPVCHEFGVAVTRAGTVRLSGKCEECGTSMRAWGRTAPDATAPAKQRTKPDAGEEELLPRPKRQSQTVTLLQTIATQLNTMQ